MATMIPDGIGDFKTEGERKFYRFLESSAKPDSQYTTWYLPDIEGKEPDFILFGEDVGLIVFEVKDWSLEQIVEASPRAFILRMGRERRSFRNPLHQAREYLESLLDRIRADGRLLSKDPRYHGKPGVPLGHGVVFPNISKDLYCRRGLDSIINPSRIFFRDDMHSTSEICSDNSGRCFKRVLLKMFPPRFRFNVTTDDYHHLKQLLFPVVRIEQPERDTCFYIDPSRRVSVLDDRQESLARNCSQPRHIISGPAGSGKTLILVHKAAFLRRYTTASRILFVCYNIALVNYIKRLLAEKGVGLGPDGVEVFHFFELCAGILGEEVRYERENGEYYRLVAEAARAGLKNDVKLRYDAILVDEGQDFTDEMFSVIEALQGGDGKRQSLTVALDEEQNVYGRPLTWKTRLMEKGARLDELRAMYRNTVEIRRFALGFGGRGGSIDQSKNVHAVYCDTHGPVPELIRMSDMEELYGYVADALRTLREDQEYPLSEIAVLYTRHRFTEEEEEAGDVDNDDSLGDGDSKDIPSGLPVPRRLVETLESRGIMCNWLAEDYRSKRFYDITSDRVAVSTIHSARGLDYACVFLIGADQFPTDAEMETGLRKLIHTGITRARHRLVIPYVHKTPLIEELLLARADAAMELAGTNGANSVAPKGTPA